MSKEIIVTGCHDCPMNVYDSGQYICIHPNNWGGDKKDCPLKINSLIIKLQQDGDERSNTEAV